VSQQTRAAVLHYGAPALAILVYAGYGLLYVWDPDAYQALLAGLGIRVWPYPFLDLESVLTAIDCTRQGADVTLPNACMGGGMFQYSPLLLQASALPIGVASRVPLGVALDGLFLLSLFALPKPKNTTGFLLLLLASLSSSTLFALERANFDVAMYLMVVLGACLVATGPRARLFGYADIVLAAALKFYPAAAMILAFREPPRRFLFAVAATTALGLALVASQWQLLGHVMPRLPQGNPFIDIFSATSLPLGLAVLANGGDEHSGLGLGVRILATFLLFGTCVGLAVRLAPGIRLDLRALDRKTLDLLVAGAAIIALCFLAAKNVHYRAIFLLPTLPGLWALARLNSAHAGRYRFATRVVVFLLWSEFFRMAIEHLLAPILGESGTFPFRLSFWLLRELLWWWLVGLLGGILLGFVCEAPIVAAVASRLPRPTR
jgi:hypothetical protein